MSKTLLSGVKPTGRPHIGNYFGALKQFVDLQNQYDCYIMIADYHALNFIQNGEQMRELTLNLAIDYLAIGLDPKKVVLFKQSDISAHTELTWIFDTITMVPYLMLSHAFKTKVGEVFFEKNPNFLDKPLKIENDTKHVKYDDEVKRMYSGINVGTFNYPMLMAADILLYSPDVVPVGQDQKQHIEYTRDTAEKFNRIFGQNVFKLPEPMIIENVKTVPGADGRKMSKSYGNDLGLFATDDEIKKYVMGIVTDSSGERPENVYSIHSLFRSKSELDKLYSEKKGKYKDLKDALVSDLITFITPLRERRAAIAKNPNKVLKILAKGGAKANKVASVKMLEAKRAVGVN